MAGWIVATLMSMLPIRIRGRTVPTVISQLAASLTFAIEAPAQIGNVEQTLLQLERDWEQANAKNDLALLDRILAPEFVNTDADGRRLRELT